MEKLDQSVLSCIIDGPSFEETCHGEEHADCCLLKTQLCSNPDITRGFKNPEVLVEALRNPIELAADMFTMGFILAREYYSIKRLEDTVFNTGEK